MKSYYLPFLIGSLCLLAGCKSEEEESVICSTPEPSNYYPLAVGNYWVYLVCQPKAPDIIRIVPTQIILNTD